MQKQQQVAKEINTVLKLINFNDYATTLSNLSKDFKLTKRDENDEYTDFTMHSSHEFRVYCDFDDSVQKVYFDLTSHDVDEMDEDERYELQVKYHRYWHQQTAALTDVLGPPLYADGFGNKGYPEDTEAQWVSVWVLGDTRLTLEVHDAYDILPQYMNAVYMRQSSVLMS